MTTQSMSGTSPSATSDAVSPDILRRVTMRLMPFLLLCYFVSFLDRGNVSFAALQMNKDLGLSGAQYGFGAGLFFLTYCLFEVPSNLILFRLGATRWIARIMLTWGLCAAGMAFVVGPTSFYALRLLLGAAEAGFFPGVLFFLTLWFPANYRGRILGLFMGGVAISGAIGAPISAYLLSFDGWLGLRGWQWLFLIEGAPAIVLAPLCLGYLQDGPEHASCVPPGDRAALRAALEAEQPGRNRPASYSFLRSLTLALTNPRVLFLACVYFADVCLLNAILFFLPLILKGFGMTNMQTGIVAAIPSLVALVAVILWGRLARDRRRERTGHAALALIVGGSRLASLGAASRSDLAHRRDHDCARRDDRVHSAVLDHPGLVPVGVGLRWRLRRDQFARRDRRLHRAVDHRLSQRLQRRLSLRPGRLRPAGIAMAIVFYRVGTGRETKTAAPGRANPTNRST